MSKKAYYFFWCGLFLIIDQTIKYLSRFVYPDRNLLLPWLGWMPFENPGIAFSLPLPNWLIILFSFPVLVLIVFLFIKSKENRPSFGLLLILTGAISNLIDRIFLKYTADYFLVFTAIINLADLMIVSGFLVYFFFIRHPESKPSEQKV